MKKKLSNRLYSYISKIFLLCGIMFLGYSQMHAQELPTLSVVSKPTLVEGKYDVELTYTGYFDCCNSHKMETFFANGKINLLFTGTLAMCPAPDTCIKTLTYVLKDLQSGKYTFNYGKDTTIIIGEQPCIDSSKIIFSPCIALYDPVCGCNGVTYGNSCLATNNGVLSYTKGACGTFSAMLGSFTFTPLFNAESDTYDMFIVGKLYPDGCVVDTFHVNIVDNTVVLTTIVSPSLQICSEFEEKIVTASIKDLKPGTYHFVYGLFDTIIDLNYNTEEPFCIDSSTIDTDAVCTYLYDPVCGCNNVTYANPCLANKAGVVSYTNGECKKQLQIKTPQITVSSKSTNVEGIYDVEFQYTGIFDCCNTQIMGVNLLDDTLHLGFSSTLMACDLQDTCEKTFTYVLEGVKAGEYVLQYGFGDSIIVIGEKPCIDSSYIVALYNCEEYYKPVCGCNDVTYGNECLAMASGVNRFSEGICEKIEIVSIAILNNNSIIQVTFDKPVTLYDGIENDFKIIVELLEKTGELYQIKQVYGLLGGSSNTIVLELVKPLPSKNVKVQFKTGDVFNTQTGLKEVDSNSLIVYPNPADSYIYIAERNVTKIEIVSINSQETAKTVNKIKYPIQISVHDLARGWYVVKVHTKDKVISSKFFKN